jgi:S1-C subfamily serine protease
VFNSRGEVIAVNAATMTRFGGASFGVPIGMVLDLLPTER